MDISIREAVIDDYESLCKIYAELDTHHRVNHPELFIEPDDYARAKEYVLETINDNNKIIFVAEVESKVVGFAECYIQESSNFPVNKKRRWVQLDSISVISDYQNNHLGSLLLKKVIEWAKIKQISRIELKVYFFNKNAIEFYSGKKFNDLNKTMYLDL